MNSRTPRTPLAAATLACLFACSTALADGDCVPRPPTAAQKKAYGEAYALFLKIAPAAPAGWTYTDHPASAAVPTICAGSEGEPIRRSFSRDFHLEQGRQERQDRALAAYTDMAKKSQEMQAKNQAAIEALDARINTNMERVQKAAAAQRFDEIEAINLETERLMQQKTRLMGLDEADATSAGIEADEQRDTEARFQLSFEAPPAGPREGEPYRTSAGRARVSAYDDQGVAYHDVTVDFDSRLAERPVVRVHGDPRRVRALIDTADLKTIATLK